MLEYEMSKKLKILLLLFVLFILANMIIGYIVENNKQERIDLALYSHLDKLNSHYKLVLEQQRLNADAIYKATIADEPAIEIMSNAWNDKLSRDEYRDQFYKLLRNKYRSYQLSGVLQFHLVFPDNTTFIRMHKKTKFNDDLSRVRLDMKKVNMEKEIIRGLSPGKTSHAFRNIYPIFDKDKNYIGLLDISFPSEILQNLLTDTSNIHTHLLINKNVLSIKAWDRNDKNIKYQQSGEHEQYYITITKKHDPKKCVTNLRSRLDLDKYKEFIEKNMEGDKKFSLYIDIDEKIKVLSFLPINHNINTDVIGWLVSYEEDDFIKNTIEGAGLIKIFAFFILGLLFYFIFRVLNQKQILNEEVDKKTNELKKINLNLEDRVKEETQKNLDKEITLFEQSKLAEIGSMVGNIAHQWRQPLSVISILASGTSVKNEYGTLEKNEISKNMQTILDEIDYLNETVDTFRNYLKEEKEYKKVYLQDRISLACKIVEPLLKDNDILLKTDIEEMPIEITMVVGELIQVVINIINNSKDALLENSTKNAWTKLSLYKEDNKAIISIEDNAGGIPDDIISKVFDEYFTTKDESKGTGIGLYMSKKIINDSFNGDIYVKNSESGAKFYIELPLDPKSS